MGRPIATEPEAPRRAAAQRAEEARPGGLLGEIGVTRIINGIGTTTLTGGSVLSPGVLAAMAEASQVFLDMPELHQKAGAYVAKMLGVEGAYITSGASAALVLSLTACMTGGELEKVRRVPRTEGMKNEVIVQAMHRNMYDRGIELAGGRIVEVGTDERTTEKEFRDAFTERTAAVVYFVWDPQKGVLPLERVLAIAHERGVPVITDAAAELPPAENLTKYLRMGSDLALFSGGKDIAGPNDTGLLLGRKDLVDICHRLGPHSYAVVDPELNLYRRTIVFTGRPMKTSKEDVLGLIAALSEYLRVDHGKRIARLDERVKRMVSSLSGQKTARVARVWPGYGQPRPLSIPRVEIEM
ncbi:MAG: aminotransferase class V-fold PLP-dependent enzyme, partial [Nitrososphaerales archaeon]